MIGFLRKFGLAAVISTRKPQSEQTVPELDRGVVSKVICSWPDGRPFRVQSVLNAHPELADSDRALIDLAVEEYANRIDAGEDVSATAFAQQFPRVQTALLDSLLFEHAVEDMTDWFRDVLEPARDEGIQWPEVGDEIAGLRLVEPLGRGGFSRVFVAEDMEYENRRVAVKICRDDTHETRTLAGLQHSGLGIVHCVRRIPDLGLVAICMPFASRTTLHDALRCVWHNGHPATPRQAWDEIARCNGIERDVPPWAEETYADWVLELAIGISHAVAASHEQDIVHCDIKPSNVLVTAEGQPIVIDFNVAFRHNAQGSPANVGGTLPYMAPEQIRAFAGEGYSDIGLHTDVFGIGATLYQMLTGHLPFGEPQTAADGIAPLLEARQADLPSIRCVNPDVSPQLDELIRSCLRYESSQRPRDAQTLADELQKLRYRARRPHRRQRVDRTLLAMVVAAALMVALHMGASTPPPSGVENSSVHATLGVPDVESALLAARRGSDVNPDQLRPALIADAQQLVDDGVSALQSGMVLRRVPSRAKEAREFFESAESSFKRAVLHDETHKGAFIGRIRSLIQLGRPEDAAGLGSLIVVDGTPETDMIQALCFAAANEHGNAVKKLERAIAAGFDTNNARVLLAYCLLKSIDPEKVHRAETVLTELQSRLTEPIPLINVLLVKAHFNQRITTPELIDTVHVDRLFDDCPQGIERGLVGPEICMALGLIQQSRDSTALHRWSERAVEEFRIGQKHGLERKYWNRFRKLLDPTVEEASEFADVPQDNGPDDRPLIVRLYDPFAEVPAARLRDPNLQNAPAEQQPNVDAAVVVAQTH